jgi:hypothetical protein
MYSPRERSKTKRWNTAKMKSLPKSNLYAVEPKPHPSDPNLYKPLEQIHKTKD